MDPHLLESQFFVSPPPYVCTLILDSFGNRMEDFLLKFIPEYRGNK